MWGLYALSNVGSLLALVSYPFVFEPAFATQNQAEMWSWGFFSFVALCAVCAFAMFKMAGTATVAEPTVSSNDSSSVVVPTVGVRFLWFGLAMAASVMLLATTNQVCMDVASVPFLWVLPLTLYLVSFILCFDSDRWYSRRLFSMALAVSMTTVCVVLLKGAGVAIMAQVLIYFAGLFFCAMVCHGELVRLKPDPRYLTSFYLVMAAGGAAGGLFVGIIAPAVFPAYLELHIGILGCCVLTLAVFFRDRHWVFYKGRPRWAWASMICGLIGLALVLRAQAGEALDDAITISRNFYGVLKVTEGHADDPAKHRRKLMHGRILHGSQFLSDDKHMEPTAYYGRESGVGLLLADREPIRSQGIESADMRNYLVSVDSGRHVGAVGLGVGTIATYGRPGDFYRFYEINPDVIRLANEHFTYLSQCRADVKMVLGDARLRLEHEKSQQFDVFVLDAFSGDAVPAHLLTVEAFEIYLKHLKADGILAAHISNLHFDLRPVVKGLADHYGLATVTIITNKDKTTGTNRCMWLLASHDASRIENIVPAEKAMPPETRTILWTDDRSNLFEILR